MICSGLMSTRHVPALCFVSALRETKRGDIFAGWERYRAAGIPKMERPLSVYPSIIPHMQSPQITFTILVARTIVPHSGQTYRRDPLFALPALLTGLPLPVPITGTTISRSFRHSCIS